MQDTTSPPGFGLFDYLVALARHIKLLLIAPVLVGVLTYLWLADTPKSYVSTAIVFIPQDAPFTAQQVTSLLRTPAVLDPAAAALGAGWTSDALAGRLAPSVGKDGMVRLDTTGSTPQEAQAAGAAVLDAWLKTTVPGERDRVDLKLRLERARAELAKTEEARDALTKALVSGQKSSSDTMLRLVELSDLAERFYGTALLNARRLEGTSRDVIKQQPTLSLQPIEGPARRTAIRAALGTLAVLTVLLLGYARLEAARSDPRIDFQLRRLRGALGGRKGSGTA